MAKHNNNQTDRLSSWKEIAAYLECDIRTCRRWEILKALPVHRIGGSEKARVFSYPDELDRWLDDQARSTRGIRRLPVRPIFRRMLVLLPLVLIFGATAYVLIGSLTADRNPFGFRIERTLLVVLNQAGRELWRYDTRIENLIEDRSYREDAQYKRRVEGGFISFPKIVIKDVRGDGKNEVLFSIQTQDESREGSLICFNSRGRRLWSFEGGRELSFGRKTYSADYRIKGFDVSDIDGDGTSEILVFSVHNPDYPCQLAVLDGEGTLRQEFWNAGYLTDYALYDLDANGRQELLLTGMNNEYGKGFLAVFDPEDIRGMSPQVSDSYRCPEISPGSQLAYVLFPRTDVRAEYPVDAVLSLRVLNNGHLSLTTHLNSLIFELNPDLSVFHVTLSNTFKEMHNAARAAGEVSSTLDEVYLGRLRDGLLYLHGESWQSAPEVNLKSEF
jgi:hypothetical protein